MGELQQIEEVFTPQELATKWKMHRTTIQRLFKDEPGVMIYGSENRRDRKRDHVTLRIPISVAHRVFQRMKR